MIKLLLIIGLTVFSVCLKGQDVITKDIVNFEKEKWLSSSAYRYEIVKSDKFPSVTNITEKEIVDILGKPNFKINKRLTYCFDLNKDSVNQNNCMGSYLTIELNKKIPERYRLTIAWVEPYH